MGGTSGGTGLRRRCCRGFLVLGRPTFPIFFVGDRRFFAGDRLFGCPFFRFGPILLLLQLLV